MVPILTTASSPLPLEPTRQFLRLLAGKPFDVPPPNTLTWFTLISPSETACRLAVSNMHWYSLTEQPDTIDVLVWSHYIMATSFPPFLPFDLKLADLPDNFDVTVMNFFLVATFTPSSILSNPLLLPGQQDGNLQMALLNLTGRLWCTCHAPIWWKSRCPARFGTSQSNTPPAWWIWCPASKG